MACMPPCFTISSYQDQAASYHFQELKSNENASSGMQFPCCEQTVWAVAEDAIFVRQGGNVEQLYVLLQSISDESMAVKHEQKLP